MYNKEIKESMHLLHRDQCGVVAGISNCKSLKLVKKVGRWKSCNRASKNKIKKRENNRVELWLQTAPVTKDQTQFSNNIS